MLRQLLTNDKLEDKFVSIAIVASSVVCVCVGLAVTEKPHL